LQNLLDKAKLWDHVEKDIVAPTNPKLLVVHVEKDAKTKRIIIDSVKDCLINHIAKKKTNKIIYMGYIIFQLPLNKCY
jgi:hypothetical protein